MIAVTQQVGGQGKTGKREALEPALRSPPAAVQITL
jgi:hypothetical protein